MGNKSTSFIALLLVLYKFDPVVTARPFHGATVVEKRSWPDYKIIDREDEQIKRDSVPFDPQALINTPFLTDDDNEPIKRDELSFAPNTLINTPILSDENEPIKRDETTFDPQTLINTPILSQDDDEPIKRNIESSKSAAGINMPLLDVRDYNENSLVVEKSEKRKRQGTHIDYFGNESAETQADGSDDLFGGADSGPIEYWPNGYGN